MDPLPTFIYCVNPPRVYLFLKRIFPAKSVILGERR